MIIKWILLFPKKLSKRINLELNTKDKNKFNYIKQLKNLYINSNVSIFGMYLEQKHSG